jgi:hypothetical protein
MVESANIYETRNLLTVRNIVLAVAAVLTISLLWACFKMLQPKDSDGRARDTYGTRGDGFRGLYEILDELAVPVVRGLAPPHASDDRSRTLALLGPNPQLLMFEPKYLTSLLAWVDEGGRLVVAPKQSDQVLAKGSKRDFLGEEDVLKLLEISDRVSMREQSPSEAAVNERDARRNNSWGGGDGVLDDAWDSWTRTTPPPREFQVKATGSLAKLAADVRRIATPGDTYTTLEAGSTKPAGMITFENEDGEECLLAAAIERGKGEIIVVSDPALFSNALVARNDNSVLAVSLLSPRGQPVDFDEYYHGLAVRGNPLFLLTRPGFAAVAFGLLLMTGIVVWRGAVYLGPPLPDAHRSRRGIEEYVRAMGSFFCRGPGHRPFLIREIRDGVLRELCEELHLPPHTPNVDKIVAALRRRNPERAEELEKSLADVDRVLDAGCPQHLFLPSAQRLAGCL